MQPQYILTDKMLNRVVGISELTALLVLEKRALHLRKENRIRSIQSSLAIENNSLTLEQVTDIIDGKRVLGAPKEIHEVQNAYEAYERVFQLNPYRVDDFLRAHRLLTKDLVKRSGQFRAGDVGVYDSQGTVVHVGARPQFVPKLVQDLFEWAEKSTLPDLIKSCIVHFELEIIHPFEDGNGRMGRLWQSLILYQWQDIFEWIPVETVIYEHQQTYYDSLSLSNHQNDATIFIEFMLDAILETLQEYSLKEKSDKMSDKELLYFKLLEKYLKKHGVIASRDFQNLSNLSPSAARRYLTRFTDLGLLVKKGQNRNRQYQLRQDLS
ncbi:Fic family protein [Streptococcus merionis]|uniref:Huntington interacting protein HYPE n=1 Tax=Streptococcus merionis TaxID=400065 RepID=A0A239SWW5_9STRE|nr:Fic family protein [Streptococcus merionis]SNU89224.1 huntington interacting protein HYPE [Streptococcus merionis]